MWLGWLGAGAQRQRGKGRTETDEISCHQPSCGSVPGRPPDFPGDRRRTPHSRRGATGVPCDRTDGRRGYADLSGAG